MYTIERFFWTNLPNGVIAFGWFTIAYSIITALLCMLQAILNGLVWYTNLGVGTGFLLIVAVKNRSDILLLPWLGVNVFHIFIFTPIAFIMLIWKYINEPDGIFFGALIYLSLYTVAICYGWIGVYSLYLLLKNETQYRSSTRTRAQI